MYSYNENKKKGKVEYCVVKLDMHKDYDRVEWRFLYRMMERLGFTVSSLISLWLVFLL